MPDQPQPTTSPSNNNRITAMLQDLAAQRSGGQPSQTASPPPLPTPPNNLPVLPTRPSPVPTPVVGAIQPPRPSAPPPSPREPIISVAPIPKPPTPPAPAPLPSAPRPVAPTAVVVPPPRPIAPPATDISTELRTMTADIGNIKIGQAPQGVKPPLITVPGPSSAAPVVPQPMAQPPAIVIPSSSSSGSGSMRKVIYGVMALLILGIIIYSLSSLLGGSSTTPVASVTPTASVSPVATLGGKNLRSYFPLVGPTVSLTAGDTAGPDLLNALLTSNPSSKQALRLNLTVSWQNTSVVGFLNEMTGAAPSALATALGADWALLSYGQQEQFDSNGSKILNATTSPRLILVAEVKDATATNQAMATWESATLASDADMLFGYDFSKSIVASFSSGTYRQIPVRYRNFPYADKSLDYTTMTASNNKNYLVLSSSRESLFFAVDQLMQ